MGERWPSTVPYCVHVAGSDIKSIGRKGKFPIPPLIPRPIGPNRADTDGSMAGKYIIEYLCNYVNISNHTNLFLLLRGHQAPLVTQITSAAVFCLNLRIPASNWKPKNAGMHRLPKWTHTLALYSRVQEERSPLKCIPRSHCSERMPAQLRAGWCSNPEKRGCHGKAR
jgi:hypothetical protein